MRGLSVTAAYSRRWYGNFPTTQNLLVSNADFSSYCVTVPTDARLPGGGGNTLCGYYDINPNKLGQNDNLIQQAADFGDQHEVYDGFDFTANARLPRGVQFAGGVVMVVRVRQLFHAR